MQPQRCLWFWDGSGWQTTSCMRQREGGQGHSDLRLLSQLTSQGDKENGSTPLHLAASWGGLPSANWFHRTHPYFWGWSASPARLLLRANESMAYQTAGQERDVPHTRRCGCRHHPRRAGPATNMPGVRHLAGCQGKDPPPRRCGEGSLPDGEIFVATGPKQVVAEEAPCC